MDNKLEILEEMDCEQDITEDFISSYQNEEESLEYQYTQENFKAHKKIKYN